MKKWLVAVVFFMVSMSSAVAGTLMVSDARVRLMPPGVDNTAIYLTLHNSGDQEVTIARVRSDISDHAALHRSKVGHEGMRVMEMIKRLVIPAHGRASFVPGGNHIMLMGLHHPLKEGDQVRLWFSCTSGAELQVMVPVVDMR